ncbi:hypothetical protein [Sphingomonas sp. Root720]|uniref:hypothetical protein n=1 Tax=Sphingomonas sp. Root720 TaxID=1736595 RepID=UPI0006F4AD9B|nr:hypothetical protein [Sphingomonas sp. Root720]KQX25476.1 hypothetical protein ASD17_22070 [Sphingomonas sp. Root1294]KQY66468.1 hypothetical protein ASD39_11875 [Sphingomonas sp. Root50]KRB90214.1 hypothetical protein ASE22_15075 [Sphingomonas sp. Root720]
MRGIDESGAGRSIGAAERILRALSAEFPRLHDRQSFLDSDALRAGYEKDEGVALADNERQAAARTLTRMISDGTVSELLWPAGHSDKVQLPEQGMIAVSVNLGSLREERLAWEVDRQGPEPSQERIISEIVDRSRVWIEQNMDGGKLPLLLVNASIIHGSNAFDILISAQYRNPYNLLRYTREVVQVVAHIAGTHTMLVAQSYGFPDFTAGR